MSLLTYSKNQVKEYQKKYNVKFQNEFPRDFLRGIYAFKNTPVNIHNNIRQEILYNSILNMFNYNFWPKNGINYSRSKELNNLLLSRIYPEIDLLLTDRKLFLKKLKTVLLLENFKMIDWYIEDINKLFIIDSTNFEKDLSLIEFELGQLKFVNKTYSDYALDYLSAYRRYYKFLKRYFSGYGHDKFQKREILAWNLITENIGLDRSKLINLEKCFIPIDYRIPSILKHAGVLKLPVQFDKYFLNKEILSSEDEKVLRSFTYLTLQKLKKNLKRFGDGLADYELDKTLFNMYSQYRDVYGESHFKYNTTAY